MDLKVDAITAENEFNRFVEMNCLDLTTGEDEDREDLARMKRKMITAISEGLVEINEKGLPVINSSNGTVEFNEPTGALYTAMDRRKPDEKFGQIFASIAQMTKTSIPFISKLPKREVGIAMTIFALFLAE